MNTRGIIVDYLSLYLYTGSSPIQNRFCLIAVKEVCALIVIVNVYSRGPVTVMNVVTIMQLILFMLQAKSH